MTLFSNRLAKGWSNVQPSRCRAAHYVDPNNNTRALCGAPIRTLAPTKRHTREVCDWCQAALRRERSR